MGNDEDGANKMDYGDGKVQLKNRHITHKSHDILYHFDLNTAEHDMKRMFGDVKFVCVGGSPKRMESFGQYLLKSIEYRLPAGQSLCDISGSTDRYSMYKVGPILSVSHGMGIPSVSIMLHEIFKLLFHAECKDVTFFRIGTCGGLGLEPGCVVISDKAVDGMLNSALELPVLGKLVSRPAILDQQLALDLKDISETITEFKTVIGTTMCTNDFYEGQGRIDGAFCDYSEEDKLRFLNDIHSKGVRNIEMESLCFAAMCHHVGIKAACICVTVIDRLQGDQIDSSSEDLAQWQVRPQQLVSKYIQLKLARLSVINKEAAMAAAIKTYSQHD